MLPASDDAPRVREHIDRLEASSREEAFRSNSAPPTTRGQGQGSSEKGEEGSVGGPPTPERAASRPIPAPSPPYLPDTRPATVAVSSESHRREEGKEHPKRRPHRRLVRGSQQDAALSVPTTRPSRRDVPADREEEPGWMRYLFLGEAGAGVPVRPRGPSRPSTALGARRGARLKRSRLARRRHGLRRHDGFSTTWPPHALCLPGRSFTHFASLEFSSSPTPAFAWACFSSATCSASSGQAGVEIAAKTSDVTTEQTLRRDFARRSRPLGRRRFVFPTLVSAAATLGFLPAATTRRQIPRRRRRGCATAWPPPRRSGRARSSRTTVGDDQRRQRRRAVVRRTQGRPRLNESRSTFCLSVLYM